MGRLEARFLTGGLAVYGTEATSPLVSGNFRYINGDLDEPADGPFVAPDGATAAVNEASGTAAVDDPDGTAAVDSPDGTARLVADAAEGKLSGAHSAGATTLSLKDVTGAGFHPGSKIYFGETRYIIAGDVAAGETGTVTIDQGLSSDRSDEEDVSVYHFAGLSDTQMRVDSLTGSPFEVGQTFRIQGHGLHYRITDGGLDFYEATTGTAAVDVAIGYAASTTTIHVDTVAGAAIATGDRIKFNGHDTVYTVTGAVAIGAEDDIVIAPGLTAPVLDDEVITKQVAADGRIVFTPGLQFGVSNNAELVKQDHARAGDGFMRIDTVATSRWRAGDRFTIAGQDGTYEVTSGGVRQTDTKGGLIEFTPNLAENAEEGAVLTKKTPAIGDTELRIDTVATSAMEPGNHFRISGDTTDYTVTEDSDTIAVSTRGRITITPALVAAPANNAVITKVVAHTDDTQLSIDTVAGGSFGPGDLFRIAGNNTTYEITDESDTIPVGGAGDITFTPAIAAVPADNAVITKYDPFSVTPGPNRVVERQTGDTGELEIGSTNTAMRTALAAGRVIRLKKDGTNLIDYNLEPDTTIERETTTVVSYHRRKVTGALANEDTITIPVLTHTPAAYAVGDVISGGHAINFGLGFRPSVIRSGAIVTDEDGWTGATSVLRLHLFSRALTDTEAGADNAALNIGGNLALDAYLGYIEFEQGVDVGGAVVFRPKPAYLPKYVLSDKMGVVLEARGAVTQAVNQAIAIKLDVE